MSESPEGSGAPAGGGTLGREELRRRASAGLFVLASWSAINLVLAFGGNLVLARLLVPRDFGLVAIGATLIMFAQSLCEGGLGSGLIRRPEPPTRNELRAVLTVQLALTSAIALVAAAIAAPLGEGGLVVAIMVAALPVAAFQTPGRVVLDRQLLYERLSLADLLGVGFYYAWSIAGVLAGFGVWALATAAIVRPLVTAIALATASGLGTLRPSFRGIGVIRPLIAFGIRFQATSLATVARDQLLNVLTAVLGGVSALGLWSLVSRVMQVPLLFFQALWRVSFPAMSQLLAAKEDPVPAIERSAALAAVGSGLVLTALGGGAPELIPAVFGEQWRGAAMIVVWGSLAYLIVGPISVATVGYLYAADAPGAVLRASVAFAGVWIGVSAALLPVIGVEALGIGWVAGSIVNAITLERPTARLSGARILPQTLVPLLAAVISGGVGVAIARSGGPGFITAAEGALAGLGLYVVALTIFHRPVFFATLRMAIRSVRAATAGRRGAASSEPAAA